MVEHVPAGAAKLQRHAVHTSVELLAVAQMRQIVRAAPAAFDQAGDRTTVDVGTLRLVKFNTECDKFMLC